MLVIASLLGLIAGTIINALADDLPLRKNPSLPHYPDGSPRPVLAWSGLIAFLTGRRESADGARLGWRYPLTELLTIVLMIVTVQVTADDPSVDGLQLAFYLLYVAIFVLITVIDIEHRLILFVVIIPSAAIALLDAVTGPVQHMPDLRLSLLGGILGFLVFFVLYLGGILFSYVMAKIRGYDLPEVAFGYGDVMLAALCGLILGWQPLIFAIFIAVFLGALGAMIYLVVRSLMGRYDLFTPLPYGPYIVIGALTLMLFSEQVRQVFRSM